MCPVFAKKSSGLLGSDHRVRESALSLPTRLFSQGFQGKKTALVIGSSGALGSTVSKYLSRELGMAVIGADILELPNDFNSSDWELDGFITLPTMTQRPSVADVTVDLALGLNDILGEEDEIDLIVCASVCV